MTTVPICYFWVHFHIHISYVNLLIPSSLIYRPLYSIIIYASTFISDNYFFRYLSSKSSLKYMYYFKYTTHKTFQHNPMWNLWPYWKTYFKEREKYQIKVNKKHSGHSNDFIKSELYTKVSKFEKHLGESGCFKIDKRYKHKDRRAYGDNMYFCFIFYKYLGR